MIMHSLAAYYSAESIMETMAHQECQLSMRSFLCIGGR